MSDKYIASPDVLVETTPVEGIPDYIPAGVSVSREPAALPAGVERRSLLEYVALTPGLAMADLADIVGSSVGITERDEINRFVTSFLPDSVELWRSENAKFLEGVSSIGGSLLATTFAGRIAQGGFGIARAARLIPGARSLLAHEGKYKRALVELRKAIREQAAEGRVSAANTLRDPRVLEAARNARRIAGINGAKIGLVTEGIIVGGMNTSDFLFPEELDEATLAVFSALGVALPGIVGLIGANYRQRRMFVDAARTAHIARNAAGIDLTEESISALSPDIRNLVRTNPAGERDLRATNWFLAAYGNKEAIRGGNIRSPQHQAELTAQGNEFFAEGMAAIEGLWRHPYPGLGITNKDIPKGIADHIRFAAERDPTIFLGATAITRAPRTLQEIDELLEKRAQRVQELRSEAESLYKKLREIPEGAKFSWKNSQGKKLRMTREEALEQVSAMRALATDMEHWIPFIVRDGEKLPIQDLRVVGLHRWQDSPGNAPIQAIGQKPGEVFALQVKQGYDPTTQRTFQLELSEDFTLHGRPLEDLSDYEMSTAFAMADKMLSRLARQEIPQLTVSRKSTWLQLDAAEELLRRNSAARITYLDGLDRDSAQFLSLEKKFAEWNVHVDRWHKAGGPLNPSILRERLNLPRSTSWERAADLDSSAIDLVFNAARAGGARDRIPGFDYSSLRRELSLLRNAPDVVAFTDRNVDFLGTSLQMGRDTRGNPLTGFFMWSQNLGRPAYSQDVFQIQRAARFTDMLRHLLVDDRSFVGRLTQDIINMPDFNLARKVTGLVDGMLAGSLPFRGNRPSSGSIIFQETVHRDSATLLAAGRVSTIAEKAARQVAREILETDITGMGSLSTTLAELRRPANLASRQFFDQWTAARRHGWNLQPKTESFVDTQTGKTLHRFFLDTTDPFNRQKWRELFGEEMPTQGRVAMPMAQRSDLPAVVDDVAFRTLSAINAADQRLLREVNQILRAKGFGEIEFRNWHIPPRDYTGKHVKFLVAPMNQGGKVLRSLVADTPAELARMESSPSVQRLIAQGAVPYSLEQIREHARIWDLHWFDIADASIPTVQLGKQVKGSSAAPFTESNSADLMIRSINDQVSRLMRDVVKTLFHPQIEYARAVSRSIQPSERARHASSRVREPNIFDRYVKTLLGDRILSRETRVGSVFLPIEDLADSFLRTLHERTQGHGILGSVGRSVRATLGSDPDERTFRQLKEQMGRFLPFEDAVEFAAERFNTKPPKTLLEVSAELNRVTSALVLRYFEIAHPILNLSGVVNTMPAILNSLSPRRGESAFAYAQRVGFDSHIFQTQSGPIGVLDVVKIMIRALHRSLFGKQQNPDYLYALQRGTLDQQVAEIHQTIGALGKVDDWYHNVARKADSIIGALSDRSEEFSRTWSHMMGVELARRHLGLRDVRAVHDFAHHVANLSIGNYRSSNRPQIFQGGVGLPLGLFQTYIYNYYSRMFRYIEQQDFRSAAIQYAMQGSIYGATTVPGWNEATQLFVNLQDGRGADPVERVYSALGRTAGDIFLHGTLSSAPRLFGAQDGIAIYTRADTSPRLPTDPLSTPLASLGESIYTGIARGIDMFRAGHPGLTKAEVLEILSTFMPNRPLRHWIELAQGYSVDRRGQVIAEDTRSGMAAVARILSMKPTSEAAQIQAYFLNRTTIIEDYAKRRRLRFGTRAAIRGGAFDGEMLLKAFREYVEAGGNPAYFRTWLRDTAMASMIPRGERQLIDALRGIPDMDQMTRLLNAGILDIESE